MTGIIEGIRLSLIIVLSFIVGYLAGLLRKKYQQMRQEEAVLPRILAKERNAVLGGRKPDLQRYGSGVVKVSSLLRKAKPSKKVVRASRFKKARRR